MLAFTVAAEDPGRGDAGMLDAWLTGIAGGSAEALAQFYQRTRAAVYGFALSILRNPQDAEDVLQDAYIQVWQCADRYRSQGKPMAWLMTVTRNLATSRLRERGRETLLAPEDWSAWADECPAVTEEDRLTLEGLMDSLSDGERQVVVLHALTGLKHREIAGLLDLPLSTVLSRYNRSVKKLQNAWKE